MFSHREHSIAMSLLNFQGEPGDDGDQGQIGDTVSEHHIKIAIL